MSEKLPDSAPRTETLDDSSASRTSRLPSRGVAVGRSTELERGAVLGRYVLLDRIGAGGMGEVFAAYDPELDRRVAIKVLTSGSGSTRRLMREARALASLQHPNVLTVHDVGSVDGRVFLATELLTGSTVAQWLVEGERSWYQVLDVFLDVGRALEAAHTQGLVHRDVKPSNLMITREGRGLLVDFGIARQVADPEGAVVELPELTPVASTAAERTTLVGRSDRAGTPGFMAPEQHEGGVVGPDAQGFSRIHCMADRRKQAIQALRLLWF